MKKLNYIFMLLSFCVVTSASAQSVKPQEAKMDDYLPLLQATGYQVYSFDISEFLDDTYHFTFKVKEYVNREEVKSDPRDFMFPNRMMIADFPEDSQKRILEKGTAVDPEKGVYTQSGKITIGFMPAKVDSMQNLRINMEGMGESGLGLKLKSLKDPQSEKLLHLYESRPFTIDKFEENKFIPLVFFASFWLDEKYGFFRFCGAENIGPNLESDYVESTPHFYVIGVEISKKKQGED